MKILTGTSLCLFFLNCSISAFGWGEKGHDVVAYIAQQHVGKKAEREINRLLGGYNMVYYAAWADVVRGEEPYDFFKTWHYTNTDEGYTYATMPKNPQGDVVTAILLCVEQLKKQNQTDSVRSLYLKLLIHFVGDLHCPMHAGRKSDSGGNEYSVLFRGSPTNLHSIWDTPIVESAHTWSATEWAENIDIPVSRKKQEEWRAGGPLQWIEETSLLAKDVYANTPQDTSLSYAYTNRYRPVIEMQLRKGGYRLAQLLNEIFDGKNR